MRDLLLVQVARKAVKISALKNSITSKTGLCIVLDPKGEKVTTMKKLISKKDLHVILQIR